MHKEILPAKDLSAFIDSYWLLEQTIAKPVVSSMHPLGYPILELNLGEHWEMYTKKGKPGASFGSSIFPLASQPIWVKPKRFMRTVLVRFQPWGLSTLLPEMTNSNQVLDARTVFGASINWLEEKFDSCFESGYIKRELNQYFRSFKPKETTESLRIRLAIQEILTGRGVTPINTIAGQLDISQRRLEQIFARRVGLTPKKYAAVARFQYALLNHQMESTTTQLALSAGYYDQSHFIRQFRAFTGQSPARYFRKRMTETYQASNLYNFRSWSDDNFAGKG